MLLFRDINWGTVAITVGIMVGIAILLGVAIMVVSKVFFVAKDERIDQIVDNLAKANCGACGYPGCSGYAEALLKGEAELTACVNRGEAAPLGAEETDRYVNLYLPSLAGYMGIVMRSYDRPADSN